MKSNRLVPHQFGPGITADFTRVEQSLRALTDRFNDVPADCVSRRWSKSPMCWGYTPATGPQPGYFPFARCLNNVATAAATRQPPTAAQMLWLERNKSIGVPGLLPNGLGEDLLTWEVSWISSHPTIIGNVTVFAYSDATLYPNHWWYETAPPPGYNEFDPTEDFTLQVCVDDAWELQNRKKLRQEALVYRMRSNAFLFNPVAFAPNDTASPPHPVHSFDGFAVTASPLVLVPAGGRVRVMWTIPKYFSNNVSTWDKDIPQAYNCWSISTEVWEATQ